ncbi:hypothetical protein RhiirA1_407416 [Rhizophagus irregularis]|uniref:Uncharacterized protein n=1 Tax=Rhizophagus irregularis TaxID=588596 RepID=A0A2N0SJD1_9GLOM|nr:hypothetical protein RhiirA1_407416 [Rhizophagus irregularis]
MAENWEEISEWDIEEDIDLAQRITVHSVHSVDDEEEFQFIQAHKNPTYAAAAKWGERKSSSNNDKVNITNKISSEKKSSSTSSKGDDKEKKSSSTSPKGSKNDDKEKKSSSSSKVVKNDESENDILKGDHDVDYETSVSSKNWKETRRSNTKLHKIYSQKLMSSLISDAELESNQNLVKGDTNRDPEFKKYKLLKKSLALNKKYAEKSKSDRKNLERVEVW